MHDRQPLYLGSGQSYVVRNFRVARLGRTGFGTYVMKALILIWPSTRSDSKKIEVSCTKSNPRATG
jgi:hypothetical protein